MLNCEQQICVEFIKMFGNAVTHTHHAETIEMNNCVVYFKYSRLAGHDDVAVNTPFKVVRQIRFDFNKKICVLFSFFS